MADDFDVKDYNIYLPPLGEGTYGRVFRATYRGISDRALKIFRPGAVDLSTMSRELEKLSSVAEHHGIVTLHDFDLLSEPPYYAMGLHADQNPDGSWETRTLDRLCGHVDYREAWRLLKEIADAMAYLHRHQIVHCDVKPSNILLTDETPYRTKICDFGQSRGLAMEGFEPVGTPLYAPPEQLRDPRDSANGKGFRWDVYSFGVMAFKLVTGRLPRLQELADAERKSFDPEATLLESSIEGTLADAEGRDRIDGNRLATMTEAVEDIRWPADAPFSAERRELIERCLSLDPNVRPADMREVWNTMRTIDSNVLVKRARRLNALFGTLLVIAVWASGFAFFQAKRAKEASVASKLKTEQAEELAVFISNTLNHEELSSSSLEELYDHIASHSEAYLENLPEGRNSEKLLRISANTASERGRQAREMGNIDEAIDKFTNAYGIRLKLYETNKEDDNLKRLASTNLLVIGQLEERRGNLDEALVSYQNAFDLRSEAVNFELPLGIVTLGELAECVRGLGRVYAAQENFKTAAIEFEKMLEWYDLALSTAPATSVLGMSKDLLPLIESYGETQSALKNYDEAGDLFQRQLNVAETVRNGAPMFRRNADIASVRAVAALGKIQLLQKQPDAALPFFLEEIKLLERLLRTRSNDSELVFQIANAFSNAALCWDPKVDSDRIRSISMLQEAVSRVAALPAEEREKPKTEAILVAYNSKISDLLEMDE